MTANTATLVVTAEGAIDTPFKFVISLLDIYNYSRDTIRFLTDESVRFQQMHNAVFLSFNNNGIDIAVTPELFRVYYDSAHNIQIGVQGRVLKYVFTRVVREQEFFRSARLRILKITNWPLEKIPC